MQILLVISAVLLVTKPPTRTSKPPRNCNNLESAEKVINTWKQIQEVIVCLALVASKYVDSFRSEMLCLQVNIACSPFISQVAKCDDELVESTKALADIFSHKTKMHNNLEKLIEGFETNLGYYMSYEKLAKESNEICNNIENDPKEFLSFFQKVRMSLKYFRCNFDYKGSESYLERYQVLFNNVVSFITKHVCEAIREVNDKVLVSFLKVLEYLKSNEDDKDTASIQSIADIDMDLLYYTQSSCRYFKVKHVVEYIEKESNDNIDLNDCAQSIYEYYLNKRKAILTYLLDELFDLQSGSKSLSQTLSSVLMYIKKLFERESTFFIAHFEMVPKKYTEFLFHIEETVLEFLQVHIFDEQSFDEICVSSDISTAMLERSISVRRKRKDDASPAYLKGGLSETFTMKLQKMIESKLSVLAHYRMLELFDHAENIDQEVIVFTDRIVSLYESSRAKALGVSDVEEETKQSASQTTIETTREETKDYLNNRKDPFDNYNKIPWSQFKLEMISKGIELVEQIEKRVSPAVFRNVANELIVIIIRSMQNFKSTEAKIDHYFFLYQNLIFLKNHFRASIEEEQAANQQTSQRYFNFSEANLSDDETEPQPAAEESSLSQYLWEIFRYWFVNENEDVKENSLKLIEDELRNLAWNIREVISKERNLKEDTPDNIVFLEKLRVYVDSLDTPNRGQDLNYLLQLVLSLK